MLPEKHRKELRETEQSRTVEKLTFSAVFLLGTLLIGPLIHEVSHMSVLMSIGCEFSSSLSTSFTGIFGKVQPRCALTTSQAVAFYSVGYASTMLAGGFLTVWSERKLRVYQEKSLVYGALGLGLMASILLSLGTRGDIFNLLNVLGLPTGLKFPAIIFVLSAVSAASLRMLEVLFDTSEREDG